MTIVSFAFASAIGLGIALMALSGSVWLRQTARLYVEIIRGMPILVLLFWIAFAGVPAFVAGWNFLTAPLQEAGIVGDLQVRDVSLLWRAVIALAIALFVLHRRDLSRRHPGGRRRARSRRPRRSACRVTGASATSSCRRPSAPSCRRYGNDFVAMVKDSSLVSVLGVADITQMGKIYAAGSFRFFETYSIVAYVYLILTVGLSMALRALERRMRSRGGERE